MVCNHNHNLNFENNRNCNRNWFLCNRPMSGRDDDDAEIRVGVSPLRNGVPGPHGFRKMGSQVKKWGPKIIEPTIAIFGKYHLYV